MTQSAAGRAGGGGGGVGYNGRMTAALRFFRGINVLLLFVPLSMLLRAEPSVAPVWVFLCAALAIVPLAGLMGKATEQLAGHLGSIWGGLLNATFGNAPELIIGLFALGAGQTDLVRASIVGSILGNILLVLGASILAGGIKHRIQFFNQDHAESLSINLLLASLSLSVPAIFTAAYHHTHNARDPDNVRLSVCVALVLLLLYLASLLFALRTHQDLFKGCDADEEAEAAEPPTWGLRASLATLAVVTIFVGWESDILVRSVEGAARALGVNQVFIGVIVVAIIGNAAEHATAVRMALTNKMDVTLSIALGSSIQIAMFVAPVLVLGGLLMRHPLTYLFSIPELTAIAFSVLIAAFIAGDGKSHWLEGAQLLAAYLLIALAFFFLPP